MNLTYTTGIPDTPNNPSNDQPPMKVNTNSINSIIQIDHSGFNDNDGGYHTIIHQKSATRSRSGQGNTFTNFPAAIALVDQIFTAAYTPDTTGGVADTQIFSRTGNGDISQLSGFVASTDGHQWLGGILIQWGRAGSGTVTSGSFASGAALGTITFKDRSPGLIPFPNACFNVLTVPRYATTPPNAAGTISVDFNTLSRTGFDYRFISVSGSYTGFFWVAIGN